MTPFDALNHRLAAEVEANQFPERVLDALAGMPFENPRVLDRLLGTEPQRTPGVNEPVAVRLPENYLGR